MESQSKVYNSIEKFSKLDLIRKIKEWNHRISFLYNIDLHAKMDKEGSEASWTPCVVF